MVNVKRGGKFMVNILSSFSGISVNDLANAKEFYTNTLGLKLEDDAMGLHIQLPGGGTLFVYEKSDHEPAKFTVLNFVVESIDETIDQLKEVGVSFEHYDNLPAPQDEKEVLRGLAANQGPDIAWLTDPSGNILSIIQDK
jgi:catechol 2,3-dioxygenase-like lactoylglutathione lyase family enzyme